MHESRAALVVRLVQGLAVPDRRHADPGSAIIGLHEQRVADLVTDIAEVEQARIAAQRRHEVRRLDVGFRRHEPGIRHGKAEPHHGAVGRMLLHGLDRPGVVIDVQVVTEYRFLDPLSRRVIPVRQSVDDDVVLAGLPQVERLDADALDRELLRFAADINREIELLQQRLVADWPADIGAE